MYEVVLIFPSICLAMSAEVKMLKCAAKCLGIDVGCYQLAMLSSRPRAASTFLRMCELGLDSVSVLELLKCLLNEYM